MSPSSLAPSPSIQRVAEQGTLPVPHPSPLVLQGQLGCRCLPIKGRRGVSSEWWGSGRLCSRSWGGRVVVPQVIVLGCSKEGPRCCRCSTGSSAAGLLDVVELHWFVRVRILHGLLVSNLGSLSSRFREMPARSFPCCGMSDSLYQATSCLLSPHTLPPGLCFLQEREDSSSLFNQSLYLEGSYEERQNP